MSSQPGNAIDTTALASSNLDDRVQIDRQLLERLVSLLDKLACGNQSTGDKALFDELYQEMRAALEAACGQHYCKYRQAVEQIEAVASSSVTLQPAGLFSTSAIRRGYVRSDLDKIRRIVSETPTCS